jgi:hypothetical protein
MLVPLRWVIVMLSQKTHMYLLSERLQAFYGLFTIDSLPDCIVLQNKTIHWGENKRYEALNCIFAAGPDNNNNPTFFDIEPGGSASFYSQTITLSEGFHAYLGSNFVATSRTLDNANRNMISNATLNNSSLSKYLIKKDLAKNIPKEFLLSQNYPNPFNPITLIEYALPKDANVTIKIYSLLGQEVKTIVNEFKSAGYYSILFDATNLASGVYLYKMEAGDFKNVKKLAVIK